MLGATVPVSHRPICTLAFPLRSASWAWLKPARIRASRIREALMTVSDRTTGAYQLHPQNLGHLQICVRRPWVVALLVQPQKTSDR